MRAVLERLLQQELPPAEIIIADGGSVDATKDIVQEFIRAGHPIRLVEDADAFPGRARNLAIAQAKTSWVALTDAGTVIPPNWLGILVHKASERDGIDVVFGSYEPILDSFYQECLALAFVPPARSVEGCPFRGPTTASLMLRREVWECLGRFPEELRACEDLLFFQRLEAGSWNCRVAPGATVGWKIPAGFRTTFGRFRSYSRHTLLAGLGRTWHLGLARNWLVALLVVLLSLFQYRAWLALLPLALGLRVHRSIRMRRPWLKLRHPVCLRSYFLVGVILVWIDLAALAGCLDFLLGILPNRRTGRPPAR